MLYDKDIREPLFEFLEETYGKVRFLEEVGNGQHCTFIIEIIGSCTAMEHRPNPVKSLISAIFF